MNKFSFGVLQTFLCFINLYLDCRVRPTPMMIPANNVDALRLFACDNPS